MAGVKGKSGRKAKTVLTRQVNQIISDTAPHAVQYLEKVVKGEVKRPSLVRIEVCKFIVNHTIGTPRQKIQVSGIPGQMTQAEATKSAEEARESAVKEAEEVARQEGFTETALKSALGQTSSDSKVLSSKQYCLACLYSLTSKPSKLSSAASLVSVEAVVSIRVVRRLNFAKQLEWLSSVSIRAPPTITS